MRADDRPKRRRRYTVRAERNEPGRRDRMPGGQFYEDSPRRQMTPAPRLRPRTLGPHDRGYRVRRLSNNRLRKD